MVLKSVRQKSEVCLADLEDPVYFQIAILNIIPHDKQKEVLRDNAKHKIVRAGRRSGKTKMISGEIIRGAFFNLYPGQIVIAPTYKQAKIVFSEIQSMLRNCGWFDIVQSVVSSPYPRILFRNGGFVDFASTDNDTSIRGFHYDRLFIDEAAFIPDRAWLAIRPLGFDTGAPTWKTSTPLGKNQFWEDYRMAEGGREGWSCFHFSTFDNPYVDVGSVRSEVEEYGEGSVYVQTEIFGNFVEDFDLLFPRDLVLSCVDNYELYSTV